MESKSLRKALDSSSVVAVNSGWTLESSGVSPPNTRPIPSESLGICKF